MTSRVHSLFLSSSTPEFMPARAAPPCSPAAPGERAAVRPRGRRRTPPRVALLDVLHVAMQDHVLARVLVDGEGEIHVGDQQVHVHPEDPVGALRRDALQRLRLARAVGAWARPTVPGTAARSGDPRAGPGRPDRGPAATAAPATAARSSATARRGWWSRRTRPSGAARSRAGARSPACCAGRRPGSSRRRGWCRARWARL